MRVRCPVCANLIRGETINTEYLVALCPTCHTVIDFDPGPMDRSDVPPKPGEERERSARHPASVPAWLLPVVAAVSFTIFAWVAVTALRQTGLKRPANAIDKDALFMVTFATTVISTVAMLGIYSHFRMGLPSRRWRLGETRTTSSARLRPLPSGDEQTGRFPIADLLIIRDRQGVRIVRPSLGANTILFGLLSGLCLGMFGFMSTIGYMIEVGGAKSLSWIVILALAPAGFFAAMLVFAFFHSCDTCQ